MSDRSPPREDREPREDGAPPEDREARRGAWIRTVPVPEAAGELAEAYERLGARDRIARILEVQSLHPAALEDHVRLYRTLMFGPSPLSRAERESVAVVVSTINDCFY